MSKFLPYKKKLILDVFEKAKESTTESSFSGIWKHLESILQDDFRIQLSYKTLETYYRQLVKNNDDYNIKPLILDDLSIFLGYENFKIYCEKNVITKDFSHIKINIDGYEETMKSPTFSDIIINITNSPIFNFPEFVTRHKNGFGIAGILLAAGIFFNKTDYFSTKDNEISQPLGIVSPTNNVVTPVVESSIKENENPSKIVFVTEKNTAKDEEKNVENIKRKDCMFWNEVEYIPVFCDENVANFQVIQRNEDFLKLKKITRPDTLTTENAIGKVWYDKSNNKVEFFTHHGIHPENGKTLRNVSQHIIEKYAK